MAKELRSNKLMLNLAQCSTHNNLVEVNDSDIEVIENIGLENCNVSCKVADDHLAVLTDSNVDSEPDIPLQKCYDLPDSSLNCGVLPWENLCESLQTVFPPHQRYTYVVESFQRSPQECFDGAPSISFSCRVRINLTNETEALEWLAKMQDHSLTTYRVTRTFKAGCSRVLYKTERHCQHFRKKLTPKQTAASAMTKSKKAKRPLTGELIEIKDSVYIKAYLDYTNTYKKAKNGSKT